MRPFTDRTLYKQVGTKGYGTKRVHIVVAEKALRRPLPLGAVVHHVNEIKTDNRGCNLVICQDAAYHRLIHRRTAAYDACGHADWLKCCYCKQYDTPSNLAHIDKSPRHPKCQREYNLAGYHARYKEVRATRNAGLRYGEWKEQKRLDEL